jgi:hypothetical protein
MFGTLIDHAFPTMIMRYSQVLAAPLDAATRFAQIAGLGLAADKVKRAAGFIRRDAARPQ